MSTCSSFDNQLSFISDDDEDVLFLDDDSSSTTSGSFTSINKLTMSDINAIRDRDRLNSLSIAANGVGSGVSINGHGGSVNLTSQSKLATRYAGGDTLDKSTPWYEQRQVIASLLQARTTMRQLLETKGHESRLLEGSLCVSEIQAMLNSQREDLETDWIAEIQELKRNMVSEIRRNHLLERDLNRLDKRIALLIKHRNNIKDLIAPEEKKKTRKKHDVDAGNMDPKHIESYQHLFYLLQTEPHYLAKLVTQVQSDQMDTFLDTVILSLFGDAFSPREEYLILSLFRLAISQEMSGVKAAGDLISVDSVVPKMILTYTRRKQGHEYLCQTIAPLLEQAVINAPDLNLELNAVQIYQGMISEQEIQTGAKSNMNRGLPEEQILAMREVQDILAARVQQCTRICEQFFLCIIQSLNRMPYGMRWICKQIHAMAKTNFHSSADEVAKVIGYFVYYRFINLAIVTPDMYEIIKKELPNSARKNLVTISRVLLSLFTLKTFNNQGGDRWLQPANAWITSHMDTVRRYFDDLIQVTDPSEYLRVDKYNELTLKISPVIVVSLSEIAQTHKLLLAHLRSLKTREKDDPLELILKALPAVPIDVPEEADRDLQLMLINRFKEQMEHDITVSVSPLAQTKELVLQVFRAMPTQAKERADTKDDFLAVLQTAISHGQQTDSTQLVAAAEKIKDNLRKMESDGSLGANGGYEGFLRTIALEVINRQEIRENQRKERMRLTIALRDLRKHQSYLNEQIQQYTSYLKDVLLHYTSHNKDGSKKKANKPVKISFKELSKKGIIVESDIPRLSHGATNFYITTDTPGIFDIEAKIGVTVVGTIQIELDDLLEKATVGIQVLKLDSIVLDVNMTLHLLNKHFLKKLK
ncbi:hypothetical protein SAMD00019534_019840 [Acytostelium subglobosum LB1]|uniref:hypothetical protein n=1 Tax=Acytostelium subglobosum LB1 TaxID=1410327 RepID=UPI0006448C02|nr:hypothetical protein SAMD00019534_019840 [Acytostelium subglobosum LB1]GAM18809.1 hypothetical protein SAMD00019534_019840 [Acytostelium subglobosum LB1]|eukprot:XP_012758029.1 hypothetical protein SAMD00019534_019840 [Acytostelium subglobosum LB1]